MGHFQALSSGRCLPCGPSSPRLLSRVKKLLTVCFPSALIRDEVIPLCGFRPSASFNFRALAMPSGRYFSFRREGQLISRECEMLHNPGAVHYVLCFRNSSFAGEFTDSLLQALYLCPIIQGLSFSDDSRISAHAQEGSELLPFLVRALPSSVTHLTFDNVLSNKAALSLANVLKGVDDEGGDEETVRSKSATDSLRALAIINSPKISQTIFDSLVESINDPSLQLQYLHSLDLSGNLLGDSCSAKVLSIALSPSSSNAIKRLDLSGNGIAEGHAVARVLEESISNKPKLEVLKLSYNNFGEGNVSVRLAASLGDVLANLTCLDLSRNSLSDTFLASLGSILNLAFMSQLVCLNIANNQFSSPSINTFLSRIHNMSSSNISTKLSFIQLEGNVPLLSANQEMVLNEILSGNRQRHVHQYMKENNSKSDSDTNTQSIDSDITGEPKTDKKRPPSKTLTVLFSAPLVWREETSYYPIEMLDFKLEKSLLWQCFSEASRNIDLAFDNATTDRLQAVMTKGCRFLHFSGHGHPSCLTFEDGSGGIHWFSVEELETLVSGGLEEGETPFDFVFVSACHSSLVGETFAKLGVPHVVCCQQEAQLMDSAALCFTRAFYLALTVGRTLKDSFEIGKHAVLSSATVFNPEEEMGKFMLLPKNGAHDAPIFNAEEVPEWPIPQANDTLNSSTSGANELLPVPPQGFIGRETDLYHVLNLVLKRRFVNIVGPIGMGRSSLAAALCLYIDDRKTTLMFHNIYFVRLRMERPAAGNSSPIVSLHKQLVLLGKVTTLSTDTDLDEIINDILVYLKQTKTLLVFDKIETLDETSEKQDFHFFLGQIFAKTKDVSVLVTSKESIGLSSLANVGESIHILEPLDFRNTIKLFAYHCPHLHSPRERKELLEELTSHTERNKPAEDDLSKLIKSIVGGGIPARTFAAAYSMSIDEFKQLQNLVKKKDSTGDGQDISVAGSENNVREMANKELQNLENSEEDGTKDASVGAEECMRTQKSEGQLESGGVGDEMVDVKL